VLIYKVEKERFLQNSLPFFTGGLLILQPEELLEFYYR